MPQRQQLTWAELRVGVFILAGLALIAMAVFYVTGARFLGPKYRVVTYLPEVEGLGSGAPVELDGVQIGNVERISLTPNARDRMHNITLVLRIDKSYQSQIRTDSDARLITQGLLGDRYVTIRRGLTGTPVPSGGEVPGTEVPQMSQVVERGADVMENLSVLTEDIRGIVNEVQKGQGSLGKLLKDASLYNHLDATATKLDSMVSSIQEGQGTVGKLVTSDELYKKLDSAAGSADNVLAAVRDQKGTVGKLVYDPSLYNNANAFADKGNALLADMRAGKGTLGKLATDDTLFANMRDASANVRDATAKLNSNQGTMGKFFSDPAFYDNVTGLSGDLRLLVGDFRQNPKKFLHIKLGLF